MVVCTAPSVLCVIAGRQALTVFSREQGLAAQHLGQDASDAPHIDRLGVFFERQHDFRGPVPPGGDVFGHESRIIVGARRGPRETEIADFQVAIGIQQQVGRFQVAVKNVRRMHGLECAEGLVNEVLAMVVR